MVSKGKILELLRPDDETGKVVTVCSVEVFGVIRSLKPFRLVGGNRDYIVAGSDSGRITILQYNAEKNRFDKIHQETYGKSGCRRIVPGKCRTPEDTMHDLCADHTRVRCQLSWSVRETYVMRGERWYVWVCG